MKNLFRQWNSINIIYRILGGLLLGIILALVFPDASAISLLGTIFVNALKGIAPLLVFFLVISSLCHAGQSHGGIIRTVIFLYLFSTLLAAVIAVIASFLFPVTLTLQNTAADMSAPQSITDVFNTLLLNIVANPVDSLANANYIGILAWAVLLGFWSSCRRRTNQKSIQRYFFCNFQSSHMDYQLCTIWYFRTCLQCHY